MIAIIGTIIVWALVVLGVIAGLFFAFIGFMCFVSLLGE